MSGSRSGSSDRPPLSLIEARRPVSRWRRLVGADDPSAALKQLPFLVFTVIGFPVVLLLPGASQIEPVSLAAGAIVVGVASLIAVACTLTRRVDGIAVLVPVLDILGAGLLGNGVSGTTTVFGVLLVLPVIWLATERSWGWIVVEVLAVLTAVAAPRILTLTPPPDADAWLRLTVVPLVLGVGAAIIHDLSARSRRQVTSIRSLAEEREVMLRGAVDYTTRLRENEEALRAADRLTRSVLDAVTEQSVIGSDVTGLVDVWNPGAERLLGLATREVVGRRHVDEFHIADELEQRSRELGYPPGETVLNPGFSALVESARQGRPEVRYWTYVRADGTTVRVELAVTRRVDEAGATVGYLFVATDITQALEVDRLKDEFVGLISHELRTPLSSILGYLDLMRYDDEHPLSAEHLAYIDVAERNAHRLLRLVGDLLFTAQVGASSFSLERTRTDVAAVVAASLDSARPAAVAASVELVGELPAQLVIDADPVRIGQAVDNLISNALKFTPAGGRVTVSLEAVGGRAVISVSDTGIGIPEAELAQLFERFFRASTATRAAVPGVGLGLTITRAIVVAHEGELDVRSVVGQGTTFIVRLPIER